MTHKISYFLLFFSSSLLSIENIAKVIDSDPCLIKQRLISTETQFDVSYVKHSSLQYFPGVHFHVKTDDKFCTWLQVVRTDCKNPKLQKFIDSSDEIFPVYTYGKDFYDIPVWSYSIFSKPLSFWRAHAWAILLDKDKKTIQCLGGISWGFELSFWRLWPCMILPKSLDRSDWQQDWDVFKAVLQNFTDITERRYNYE